MSDYLSSQGVGRPKKSRRAGASLVLVVLAGALTGFLIWMGLSWAVGLIASAVRLILMSVALGLVAILVLWIIRRSISRR